MLNHMKLLHCNSYSLMWFVQNQMVQSNVYQSKPMCIVWVCDPLLQYESYGMILYGSVKYENSVFEVIARNLKIGI